MTTYRLLEQLLALEQRVRNVYVFLSQRDHFPAEEREVWKALAEDETHHIVALERSAHLFSVMDSPPTIPDQVLVHVEALVTAAETNMRRPNLTSDDAFRQALQLEGSELNHLDEAWVQGFRPTTSLLLQTLAPGTRPHIHRLVEAVHRFSIDAALQAEADALQAKYDKPHPEPEKPVDSH